MQERAPPLDVVIDMLRLRPLSDRVTRLTRFVSRPCGASIVCAGTLHLPVRVTTRAHAAHTHHDTLRAHVIAHTDTHREPERV